MRKNFSLQKGFTLIEIIIVIVILVGISILIFASFSRFNSTQTLNGTTQTVLSILDEARALTLASKNNLSYGVHFESSKVVLFDGTTYSASDPDNDVTTLNNRVTISDISLSGGVQDVLFDKLTGKTSQNGMVTITLISYASRFKTINIGTTGVSEIQ